jgi:hypothetical protein
MNQQRQMQQEMISSGNFKDQDSLDYFNMIVNKKQHL